MDKIPSDLIPCIVNNLANDILENPDPQISWLDIYNVALTSRAFHDVLPSIISRVKELNSQKKYFQMFDPVDKYKFDYRGHFIYDPERPGKHIWYNPKINNENVFLESINKMIDDQKFDLIVGVFKLNVLHKR